MRSISLTQLHHCRDCRSLQWNSWMTWDSRAIPLLENQPGLIVCEMIYPTTLGATDYASCYDKIVDYVQCYSAGHKPAIGLSIYTSIAMDTCVSWALMAAQIDAAKAAGQTQSAPHSTRSGSSGQIWNRVTSPLTT